MRWFKKNNERVRAGKDGIEVPPFQVFDAKYLDDGDNEGVALDRDFSAFICAKELFDWNKKTDMFGKK